MRRALVAVSGLVLLVGCNPQQGSSSSAASGSVAPSTSAAPRPSSAPPDADAPEVSPPPSTSVSAAHAPAGCPAATSPDRVVAFDWGKELGVDAPFAARLRGVSGAAVEAQLLAVQVESELRPACAAIASELGGKGVYASAPVACQAAVDALRAARAKLAPPAKVSVNVHPAVCPQAIAAVKECAKRCNGDEQAPEVTCAGATVGRCPGTCDGACEMRPPGPCDGACLGRCDGVFSGACAGTCKGQCNGAEMKQPGECKGTCEGSCDAVVKGPCKGRCAGACQLHASACVGVCAGKCSVALEEPRCSGVLKIAGTGPECSAYCETRALHRVACGAAQVDVHVEGAKDAKAKAAYEGAIERYLPTVLKIEAELKDHVAGLTKAKAVVADGLKAITESGSPALPALSPCLFGYNKASVEGTDSVLASYRAASETAAVARAK